ncbi:immunity 22 family protein [Caballeronia sp. BR00000012568055]|uniref:immunity 22 family protein n=1 Tax=Caballeronia sp. BR00000012568055 TaxID=2918761 RepID=UPI0023F678B7|nr:immunity 22 family protein [Caballeronia sp. BR00000012568055]
MNDELAFECHIWIGTSFTSEEEYLAYFELDFSVQGDFSAPGYKRCQFCLDVGLDWYDEDYITIIPRLDVAVDLDTILVEAPILEEEMNKVKEKCAGLGIERANAIFCYSEPDFVVPKPYKSNYNGLKYVGVFVG